MDEQSIINAPVRKQLEAIAIWHDSENPSRMALGAVASCALNHVQMLEQRLDKALIGLRVIAGGGAFGKTDKEYAAEVLEQCQTQ